MTAFDHTKPFQTRDGRKARLLASNLKGDGPLVVAITNGNDEWVQRYPITGRVAICGIDLINIPERTSVFRAMMSDGDVGGVFKTLDDARRYRTYNPILETIYENGEPVDVKLHGVGA
jgi:hypothetical protein